MTNEYLKYLVMLEKTLEKHTNNISIIQAADGSIKINKDYFESANSNNKQVIDFIKKHKENNEDKYKVNFSERLTIINKKLLRHLQLSQMEKEEKKHLVSCLFSHIPISYFRDLIAQENKEIFLLMLDKAKYDKNIFYHLPLMNYYKISKIEKKEILLDILDKKANDINKKEYENIFAFIRMSLKVEDWSSFIKYLPQFEEFLTLSNNNNYAEKKEVYSLLLEIDYTSVYKSHAKYITQDSIIPLMKQVLLGLKKDNGVFEFKETVLLNNSKNILFLSENKFDEELLKNVFNKMLDKILTVSVYDRKNVEKWVLPTVLDLNLKENTKVKKNKI